jgi:hypothetical protein
MHVARRVLGCIPLFLCVLHEPTRATAVNRSRPGRRELELAMGIGFRGWRCGDGSLAAPRVEATWRLIIQVTMLDAAGAVRGDHLHHGITEFPAPYRARPTVGLSQELFRHWKARFPHLGLGQHYELVDDFARMLDLKGLYGWRVIPEPPQGCQPAPRIPVGPREIPRSHQKAAKRKSDDDERIE